LFSGGPLPGNTVIENGDSLKIENVQLFNSGLYTCKGEFEFLVQEDGIFVVVIGNLKLYGEVIGYIEYWS